MNRTRMRRPSEQAVAIGPKPEGKRLISVVDDKGQQFAVYQAPLGDCTEVVQRAVDMAHALNMSTPLRSHRVKFDPGTYSINGMRCHEPG
jgi:hypothetical protein